MSTIVNVANSSNYLAAEVLEELIGIELAQKANVPESVWVKDLEGSKANTAHFRWDNPFATSGLGSTDGFSTALGLPISSWAPSEATIAAAFAGQTTPVTEAINALDPEVMAHVAMQSSTVLIRDVDSSLCALFSSLTGAGVTGTGTSRALKVKDILTVNATLFANHADQVSPSFFGRLHPVQFLDLYNDIIAANYGIAKVTIDATGTEVITIGSTILKKNTNVVKDSSNADYIGAVYAYQALGLVWGRKPTVRVEYVPGSAEYAVDAYVQFGTGVLRSTLGCPVYSNVNG